MGHERLAEETLLPIWIGQVELAREVRADPVAPGGSGPWRRAHLLVRIHGQPLGFVDVSCGPGGPAPGAIVERVRAELGTELGEHLSADGMDGAGVDLAGGVGGWEHCKERVPGVWRGPVTVAVCTHDRPELLSGCLTALAALDSPGLEILVVDNAPSDGRAREIVAATRRSDPRLRYELEPLPGLSRARNRALREAHNPYVAFTDDDTLVDPAWLEGIVRGFGRDAAVGCVTGLVPAAQLDTASQVYFDQRYSWSVGFVPRLYDLERHAGDSAVYPYSPGTFGTGANFAMERRLAMALGGFDEALGAGTPARGGEDLDMFLRVLLAGRSIAYEPGAVVWHVHRRDGVALQRQLYDYGRGFAAFAAKHALGRGTRSAVARRVPKGLLHLLTAWRRSSPASSSRAARRMYVLAEIRGMASGPIAYRRGVRRTQR